MEKNFRFYFSCSALALAVAVAVDVVIFSAFLHSLFPCGCGGRPSAESQPLDERLHGGKLLISLVIHCFIKISITEP